MNNVHLNSFNGSSFQNGSNPSLEFRPGDQKSSLKKFSQTMTSHQKERISKMVSNSNCVVIHLENYTSIVCTFLISEFVNYMKNQIGQIYPHSLELVLVGSRANAVAADMPVLKTRDYDVRVYLPQVNSHEINPIVLKFYQTLVNIHLPGSVVLKSSLHYNESWGESLTYKIGHIDFNFRKKIFPLSTPVSLNRSTGFEIDLSQKNFQIACMDQRNYCTSKEEYDEGIEDIQKKIFRVYQLVQLHKVEFEILRKIVQGNQITPLSCLENFEDSLSSNFNLSEREYQKKSAIKWKGPKNLLEAYRKHLTCCYPQSNMVFLGARISDLLTLLSLLDPNDVSVIHALCDAWISVMPDQLNNDSSPLDFLIHHPGSFKAFRTLVHIALLSKKSYDQETHRFILGPKETGSVLPLLEKGKRLSLESVALKFLQSWQEISLLVASRRKLQQSFLALFNLLNLQCPDFTQTTGRDYYCKEIMNHFESNEQSQASLNPLYSSILTGSFSSDLQGRAAEKLLPKKIRSLFIRIQDKEQSLTDQSCKQLLTFCLSVPVKIPETLLCLKVLAKHYQNRKDPQLQKLLRMFFSNPLSHPTLPEALKDHLIAISLLELLTTCQDPLVLSFILLDHSYIPSSEIALSIKGALDSMILKGINAEDLENARKLIIPLKHKRLIDRESLNSTQLGMTFLSLASAGLNSEYVRISLNLLNDLMKMSHEAESSILLFLKEESNRMPPNNIFQRNYGLFISERQGLNLPPPKARSNETNKFLVWNKGVRLILNMQEAAEGSKQQNLNSTSLQKMCQKEAIKGTLSKRQENCLLEALATLHFKASTHGKKKALEPLMRILKGRIELAPKFRADNVSQIWPQLYFYMKQKFICQSLNGHRIRRKTDPDIILNPTAKKVVLLWQNNKETLLEYTCKKALSHSQSFTSDDWKLVVYSYTTLCSPDYILKNHDMILHLAKYISENYLSTKENCIKYSPLLQELLIQVYSLMKSNKSVARNLGLKLQAELPNSSHDFPESLQKLYAKKANIMASYYFQQKFFFKLKKLILSSRSRLSSPAYSIFYTFINRLSHQLHIELNQPPFSTTTDLKIVLNKIDQAYLLLSLNQRLLCNLITDIINRLNSKLQNNKANSADLELIIIIESLMSKMSQNTRSQIFNRLYVAWQISLLELRMKDIDLINQQALLEIVQKKLSYVFNYINTDYLVNYQDIFSFLMTQLPMFYLAAFLHRKPQIFTNYIKENFFIIFSKLRKTDELQFIFHKEVYDFMVFCSNYTALGSHFIKDLPQILSSHHPRMPLSRNPHPHREMPKRKPLPLAKIKEFLRHPGCLNKIVEILTVGKGRSRELTEIEKNNMCMYLKMVREYYFQISRIPSDSELTDISIKIMVQSFETICQFVEQELQTPSKYDKEWRGSLKYLHQELSDNVRDLWPSSVEGTIREAYCKVLRKLKDSPQDLRSEFFKNLRLRSNELGLTMTMITPRESKNG